MLFNNHVCKLMSQNFSLMQAQHMRTGGLNGDHISVVLPLSQLFNRNADMMYQFASEAYKDLVVRGLCRQSDFESCYNLLAIYGVLMSNLVLCYNATTDKTALYTSSITILKKLASRGILKGKRKPIIEEMQSIEDALTGRKIAISFQKGNVFQAIRLDYEYKGSRLYLTPTIPRSQLSIQDEYILPYFSIDTAMKLLNEEMQNKILRITIGDTVVNVTKNVSNLQMIYGDVRTNALLSRGYDARTNQFYAPILGASILSTGVCNLDLLKIDKIEMVQSLAQIDLSEVYMDVSGLPAYLVRKLSELSEPQLLQLAQAMGITSGDYNYAKVALSDMIPDTSPFKLYAIVKELGFFNMQEVKSLPSRWGTNFTPTEEIIPSTTSALESLLRTGIFRVTIKTRTGGYSTLVCTNNASELKKIYGDDYFGRLESEGVRLKRLAHFLKGKDTVKLIDLFTICNVCNFKGVFDEVTVSIQNPSEDMPISVKPIQTILYKRYNIVLNNKTVLKSSNTVTVRSCECNPNIETNFYRSLHLDTICGIIRLSNSN